MCPRCVPGSAQELSGRRGLGRAGRRARIRDTSFHPTSANHTTTMEPSTAPTSSNSNADIALPGLEPLRPQQCGQQVTEQEQRHGHGDPDHDTPPHTLSQAATKANMSARAARPSTIVNGIQIARSIAKPSGSGIATTPSGSWCAVRATITEAASRVGVIESSGFGPRAGRLHFARCLIATCNPTW